MKKVDTHGLKITGLRKIAGESKSLPGYYSGQYIQINYNAATGEAWGDYHVSLGYNAWSVYDDPDIIVCGRIDVPCTMQDVADKIYRHVKESTASIVEGWCL